MSNRKKKQYYMKLKTPGRKKRTSKEWKDRRTEVQKEGIAFIQTHIYIHEVMNTEIYIHLLVLVDFEVHTYNGS